MNSPWRAQMPELADAIDHIVIGTPNLEATREELIDLGFQITPHGVHEKFGTDNYLFVLEDSYVELLGVSGRPAEVRTSLEVLEPCVAAGGGVPMLALAANNMDAAHTRLQALGVEATAPLFWSRPADTPDGPRTASFTTMFVNSPMLPGLATFYCKHHTVEFVRHRAWREHRNGVQALQRLIFRSSALLAQAKQVASTHGSSQTDGGGIEFRFGEHVLEYLPGVETQAELHFSRIQSGGPCNEQKLNTVRGVSFFLHARSNG